MSDADGQAGQEAREAEAPVRLRVAERRQMGWVAECPDELVGPTHPVRLVMAVDFRTDHGDALDELFTQVIASLVEKETGVGEPGEPGRGAGQRREARLQELLDKAQQHVEELRRQVESPAYSATLTAKQVAVRRRGAEEKQNRLQQAIAQLSELKQKQAEAAKRAGHGQRGQQIRAEEPRVSTTDPEARVMKMPNGGFNPACNVQLATDTGTRAIVGVAVSHEGSDSAAPAGRRLPAERRPGAGARAWGLCRRSRQDIRAAVTANWSLSPVTAVRAWKRRMASEAGQEDR